MTIKFSVDSAHSTLVYRVSRILSGDSSSRSALEENQNQITAMDQTMGGPGVKAKEDEQEDAFLISCPGTPFRRGSNRETPG